MSIERHPRIWLHRGHRWSWQIISGRVVVHTGPVWLLVYLFSYCCSFDFFPFPYLPSLSYHKCWGSCQRISDFLFFNAILPKGLCVILFWCCSRFIFPAQISLHSRFMYPTNDLTSAAEYFLDMSDLTCPNQMSWSAPQVPCCLAGCLLPSSQSHHSPSCLGQKPSLSLVFPFPHSLFLIH